MIGRLVGFIFVFLIRAYQFAVRPILSGSCKFIPSCSEYTAEAISRHGPAKGGWLGLKRVVRCHPWSAGGFDPVP